MTVKGAVRGSFEQTKGVRLNHMDRRGNCKPSVCQQSFIPYLSDVMGVKNERMNVGAFRDFVLSGAKMNQVTSNLLNLVSTIPINLAECERSFRAKNGIITKHRASLLIPTTSSLFLINAAGPPLE